MEEHAGKAAVKKPLFSFVLPAYNEADHLAVTVGSIRKSTFPEDRYEVVLVDNGSTDGTVALARELGVRVLENHEGRRRHIATLRNLGAAATTGKIIVFLDADMEVPEGMLEALQKHYDDGFRGALGFVEKVPGDAPLLSRVWGEITAVKRDRLMDVDFLAGRNITVPRETFDAAGGFDEQMETGEDKDFCRRVLRTGGRVISSPELRVVHHGYDRSLGEFLRKEYWRQNSTLAYARQSGYTFRSLRNPILCLYQVLMAVLTLTALFAAGPVPAAAGAAAWALPSALIALKQAWKRPSFIAPLFLLTFLRWNAAGVSLLQQIISPPPKR
jgi:glycosyltransferase involved in cell wall biosynthesis